MFQSLERAQATGLTSGQGNRVPSDDGDVEALPVLDPAVCCQVMGHQAISSLLGSASLSLEQCRPAPELARP